MVKSAGRLKSTIVYQRARRVIKRCIKRDIDMNGGPNLRTVEKVEFMYQTVREVINIKHLFNS